MILTLFLLFNKLPAENRRRSIFYPGEEFMETRKVPKKTTRSDFMIVIGVCLAIYISLSLVHNEDQAGTSVQTTDLSPVAD